MRADHLTDHLSIYCLNALNAIRARALPRQEFNPGIVNKLLRLGYVEIVQLPSPFVTHKGKLIDHLRALK